MKISFLAIVFLMALSACGQNKRPATATKPKSPSETYIDAQLNLIKEHAKKLAKEGRMPEDFASTELFLAEYGWHSGNETAPGNQPPLWLLQSGARQGTGSFGAYSFSQRAFAQAQKQWWIHGVIEKGKDLLYPLNRNANFDPSVVGYRISGIYGERLSATVIEVRGKGYEWQSWGSDGSSDHGKDTWSGPLRLSKPFPDDGKEPRFVYQYDIAILSPDYVDMCGCTMSSTSAPVSKSITPCIQGGSLGPGEECSVSIEIPTQRAQ